MRFRMGQVMTRIPTAVLVRPRHASRAVIFAGLLVALLPGAANAQALGYAPTPQSSYSSDDDVIGEPDAAPADEGAGSASVLPERLRRAVVRLDTREAPGTIIIDTGNTVLYYVLGQRRAIRYGVGVGRQGFTWSGVETISRKAEWPDWHPPAQMIARQPYLPRFMAGGPGNPLGARAMYLGSSEYRIHGTNDPSTIGKFVSSGCIRLTNEDVADLFSRVNVGTKVVVLPKSGPHIEASAAAPGGLRHLAARTSAVTRSTGRQAMNLSRSSLY
jgi:lipoprotein-anchoring transpeptidase ErfK/SrfK